MALFVYNGSIYIQRWKANMRALLQGNNHWQSISYHPPQDGRFGGETNLESQCVETSS